MKKKILNIVIVIALISVTFYVIFSSISFENFSYVLKNARTNYLVLGILSMVVFWMLDAYIFVEFTKIADVDVTWWTALEITMIGQYYSFITPSASGGQPAQLYFMGKRKIPYGKGTAILVDKFIIFQMMVTVYSLVLFFANMHLLYNIVRTAITFILIGLLINAAALAGIFLLIYNVHLIEKVLTAIIRLGHKVRIIKDYEGMKSKMEGYMEDYRKNIMLMLGNTRFIIKIALLTLVKLTVYFGVTYFVYRALNLGGSSFVEIVALQALLFMAVSFMPIPGTIGASEAAFYALLGAIFTPGLVAYGMLLWRGITYYLSLVITGIFTFVLYFKYKDREERKGHNAP